MSARLRWQTDAGDGVFPLHGPLHLVWSEAGLDRVNQPPQNGPALSAEPPGQDGKVALEARGSLEFVSGERRFRKVRLPLGRAVSFQVSGATGSLEAVGTPGSHDPLLEQTIGNYRLLARLGAGAVGVVYRALQTNLDREVALKMLDPEAAGDPDKVASFLREAQAAGKLVHPNLVAVHDVGQVDGQYYYSMELVRGGSLEDRLRRDGPLPWREAVQAVRDCALALAFAEEHHLVHRDVKPANLMVANSGHVKLADLGLAATRGLIDHEAAGGTPHFMAPEAVGAVAVDHRADLYSLGCTLFRLCTAKTPFQGQSVKEILRAHRDQPPPSLKSAGVVVPAAVETLLGQLLAKDPEQRPESAAAVAAQCERLLSGRSSRRLVLFLMALLLGVGGLAAWQLTRPAQEGKTETVVQYVTDPEAVAAQARLAATERESSFYRALATSEAERAAALQAFLVQHPDSEFTARAQAEMARLRQAAAVSPAPVAANTAPAEVKLERSVNELIQAQRYVAARQAIEQDSSAGEAVRGALRERVAGAAAVQMLAWEQRHAAALAAQDWDGATALRTDWEASLGGGPAPENWRLRLDSLAAAAASAVSAAREQSFQADRMGFQAALQDAVLPAVLAFDWDGAAARYAQAAASVEHPMLAQAAAAENAVFAAAAAAALALRERVASGEEIAIVEPAGGKRALVQGVQPEGLRVLVQLRGERSERVLPWSDFATPEACSGLLRAVLPATLGDESACALHLLFGEARLAGLLRALSGTVPEPSAAAALAAEARAWLERLPRTLASEPSWLARHRRACEQLAALADSLAQADEYLAWQRGEDLLAEFSLLVALASDGTGDWGLQP